MDFAVLSSEFNVQSFCNSECSQCHNSATDLGGRLLSPAGWDIHSYPDCAKICWEKLNTSHSSCHPFTSLFISYSYISDHALQGQELQFPLHFSCVCGNAGPIPAKHLCTATMCWCETTKLSCYFTAFKHPAHKYSSITTIPKRDPVTAAKFLQIHFT